MDRLLEFAGNHPVLVSAFFVLWAVFFVIESRRGGQPVSPQQATNMVNKQDGVLLDVRAEDDFRAAHIAGSLNIPQSRLEEQLGELEKFRDKPLILVCNHGNTASAAGRMLRGKGFESVWRLRGGLQAWRAEKLPVTKA
ncbi:MAG: rhodanese-like domain-containing protein [Alcanivoracaceae bacterium]|jgi:rhodanese-related sulfurtransferase|nr:rhodanese-like domain-containing protein [Alcanivoracaceae bacterium]